MTLFDYPALIELANVDREFPRSARYWTGLLALQIDDCVTVLRLDEGVVSLAEPGAPLGVNDIRVAASAADWEKMLAPAPPPGWQDIATARAFTIEADVVNFGPYYPAIRRLLDLIREQLHGPSSPELASRSERLHDDAVGRYIYLDVQGTQYRVYYEEAGSGVPLLLLHTAGADGRQYRHLLEASDVQSRFRMIAVDLPFHGKSLPPAEKAWWDEPYLLTRDFLLDFHDAFCEALNIGRPVFMGCSVGGLLAPDLAYYRPGKYRAVISLNGALALPTEQMAREDKVRSWHHPRVANDWKSSSMLGFMAPGSPEAYRRETAWVYSQGSPPVFVGDIHYYMHDHILTAEQAAEIDTASTGVYVLTGEYDPLARTGASQQLADAIPGAHFEVNDGLGHFGPSENPGAFLSALRPVLNEIVATYPD